MYSAGKTINYIFEYVYKLRDYVYIKISSSDANALAANASSSIVSVCNVKFEEETNQQI